MVGLRAIVVNATKCWCALPPFARNPRMKLRGHKRGTPGELARRSVLRHEVACSQRFAARQASRQLLANCSPIGENLRQPAIDQCFFVQSDSCCPNPLVDTFRKVRCEHGPRSWNAYRGPSQFTMPLAANVCEDHNTKHRTTVVAGRTRAGHGRLPVAAPRFHTAARE